MPTNRGWSVVAARATQPMGPELGTVAPPPQAGLCSQVLSLSFSRAVTYDIAGRIQSQSYLSNLLLLLPTAAELLEYDFVLQAKDSLCCCGPSLLPLYSSCFHKPRHSTYTRPPGAVQSLHFVATPFASSVRGISYCSSPTPQPSVNSNDSRFKVRNPFLSLLGTNKDTAQYCC